MEKETKDKEGLEEQSLNDDIEIEDKEEMLDEKESVENIDEESGMDIEVEKIKSELEEKNTRLMRLQADFDNYRKRVEKEKIEIIKFASVELIEKLLPVLDNFDRAIAEENKRDSKDKSFFEGVELIQKQLIDVLKSEGLSEIDALEKDFDPNYHNAVQQLESDKHDSNKVIEVYQKGYQVKEKVIRPSMVVVSK